MNPVPSARDGLLSLWTPTTASRAISDNLLIGHCWGLAASQGQLGLVLAASIIPDHITIDHISPTIAANIGQAPRLMILWGAVEGTRNKERLQDFKAPQHPALEDRSAPPISSHHKYVPLAVFEYDIHGSNAMQVFNVFEAVRSLEVSFRVVVLEVVNNWGADSTCLYRVRVHGREVETQSIV